MQITVEATVRAPLEAVCHAWNSPCDIVRWNVASGDRPNARAEATNPIELQRQGWQAILDNFARHVEADRDPSR